MVDKELDGLEKEIDAAAPERVRKLAGDKLKLSTASELDQDGAKEAASTPHDDLDIPDIAVVRATATGPGFSRP